MREKEAVRLTTFIACLVGVVVLYFDTFAMLTAKWGDSTYVYCATVPFISAYLIWVRRSELSQVRLQTSWIGVAAVATLAIAWFAAGAAGASVAVEASAVGTLIAVTLALLGRPAMNVLAFPCMYLLLSVPFGEILVPRLMDLTATAAVFTVRATGIPVYRDSYFISVPAGNFEVVKACSGIRFLLMTLTLMMPLAYLQFRSILQRVAFVTACAFAAVVANSMRVFILIVAGQISDMRWVDGPGHELIGQASFGLVLLAMIYAALRLGSPPTARAQGEHQFNNPSGVIASGSHAIVAAATILFLVFASVWVSNSIANISVKSALARPATAPGATAPWTAAAERGISWLPRFASYSSSAYQIYRQGASSPVALFVAHYPGSAASGRELVNSENRLTDPDLDTASPATERSLEIFDGTRLKVSETVITDKLSGSRSYLTWMWYGVDGVVTISKVELKLRTVAALVRSKPAVQRVVVIYTPVRESDLAMERSLLADFVRQNHQQLLAQPAANRPAMH